MIKNNVWNVPQLIAHRGVCAFAPENTLASLTKARDMGASWVEADVRLTRDGEAIMFHDAKLNRCTNGRGLVSGTPYAVIATLDAGGWFSPKYAGEKVPTLDEWLIRAAQLSLGIVLDLKGTRFEAKRLAERVRVALARHWPATLPNPLISSESVPCLRAIAAYKMNWNVGYITSHERGRWPQVVDELQCISVHLNHHYLSARWIALLKERGLRIAAYTVNDPERAKQLFDWGIDSIFTDNLLVETHY